MNDWLTMKSCHSKTANDGKVFSFESFSTGLVTSPFIFNKLCCWLAWGLQKISGLMAMHHFRSLWSILVHFYRDSKFPRPEILIFSPGLTFEDQHSCISPALRTQMTRRFVCYCSNSAYTRQTIRAAVNKSTTLTMSSLAINTEWGSSRFLAVETITSKRLDEQVRMEMAHNLLINY